MDRFCRIGKWSEGKKTASNIVVAVAYHHYPMRSRSFNISADLRLDLSTIFLRRSIVVQRLLIDSSGFQVVSKLFPLPRTRKRTVHGRQAAFPHNPTIFAPDIFHKVLFRFPIVRQCFTVSLRRHTLRNPGRRDKLRPTHGTNFVEALTLLRPVTASDINTRL